MTVKGIFKTLIGTILIIVFSSLLWEIFNLQIVSLQLSTMMKLSVTKSAELFAQETYKTDNISGSANMSDIVYPAGIGDDGKAYPSGTYVSGRFYSTTATSAEDIWRSLYEKHEFENFVKSAAAEKGNWYSLGVFRDALAGNTTAPMPEWNASNAELEKYNRATLAASYLENLYTPLNIGVPYLDHDTVEKIFKWNLTQLLTSSNPDNIVADINGTPYVSYNGYRCYVSAATIDTITYETYDMDIVADRLKFREITNIKPENLGFSYDASALGINNDERKRICVVSLTYSMPVSYKGITPIKNVFNYVWNTEVDGLDGSYARKDYQQWNDSTTNISGGGYGDNTLPTSGKIVYYLVR